MKDQIFTDKAIQFIDKKLSYKLKIKDIIRDEIYPEFYIRRILLNSSFIKSDGDRLEKIDFKRFIEYFRS